MEERENPKEGEQVALFPLSLEREALECQVTSRSAYQLPVLFPKAHASLLSLAYLFSSDWDGCRDGRQAVGVKGEALYT